jgi:L-aspartate oxidase
MNISGFMALKLLRLGLRPYIPNSVSMEGSMRKKVFAPKPPQLKFQDADVVILGGGLAGLRAALAATAAHPGCRVAVVAARGGPSGSSFANPNDALGMQVCRTEAEVLALTREIEELAAPGRIDARLVELLAGESLARFMDLQDLGVRFEREPGDGAQGAAGCFSPNSRRAAIVKNLAHVHACFRQRLEERGIAWLSGWLAASLLPADGRIRGVLLLSRDESQALAVAGASTVLALGGPAPLFARHLAGPGNPGYGLGLLRRAGVPLVNAGFLQFFWSELPRRNFFPMEQAFDAEFAVATRLGSVRPLSSHSPAFLATLAASRAGHCPCAHGRPDALLDTALAGLAGPDGIVRLGMGDTSRLVALFAHAGNGGAAIDALGHTGVPGLFAAGECAGGMHGANRLGGAMVTATQVFGARAGWAAALEASLRDPLRPGVLQDLATTHLAVLPRHPAARVAGLARLGRELSRLAPFGSAAKLRELAQDLTRPLSPPSDWLLELCRESALAIVLDQLHTATGAKPSQAA